MSRRRQWSEMSDVQRTLVVVGGAVEAVLTTIALVDLARRPAAQVRGPKAVWALAAFVQPVGPIAYLVWGRRAAV